MSQVTELNQKSAIAEAYRTIRTNISFADIDNNLKTIMFTSTKQGEGKSTTISHLANTFSKLENTKVLVVDLDLRNPTIHKMFGRTNTYGIIDHLKNGRELDKCIIKIEENLHILTPGIKPPNPTEVLSSKKVEEFIKSIREEYDYVFIDAPPVGIVSDGIIVSKYADGVMFVIESNGVDVNHAKEAIDNMKKADVNIIGTILNKYDLENASYGFYSYYYEENDTTSRVGKKKKKRKAGLWGKKAKFI